MKARTGQKREIVPLFMPEYKDVIHQKQGSQAISIIQLVKMWTILQENKHNE